MFFLIVSLYFLLQFTDEKSCKMNYQMTLITYESAVVKDGIEGLVGGVVGGEPAVPVHVHQA